MVSEYLKLIWDIFIAPFTSTHILWIVLPLIIILILIHLYFGRYRTEELGWNSAFGNSISLLWVSAILWRFLLDKYRWTTLISEPEAMKSLIVIGILTLWVLILLVFNFFHIVPRKFAFIISSADSVYILAYIIIAAIVGGFVLDEKTLIAAIGLFIIMLIALQLIKHLIPISKGSKQVIKERKEKETRKKAGKKAAKTKKRRSWLKNIIRGKKKKNAMQKM
jgi:hypothetical protein